MSGNLGSYMPPVLGDAITLNLEVKMIQELRFTTRLIGTPQPLIGGGGVPFVKFPESRSYKWISSFPSGMMFILMVSPSRNRALISKISSDHQVEAVVHLNCTRE